MKNLSVSLLAFLITSVTQAQQSAVFYLDTESVVYFFDADQPADGCRSLEALAKYEFL